MSSVLVRASRALRAMPARSGAVRRMCTAVAEAAPEEGKLTLNSPEGITFLGFMGIMYLGAFRWAVKDKKFEAKKAAIEAERAAAHAPAAEISAVAEAVAEAVAAAEPAASVVAVVSAAPAGASVSEWKVSDVQAWLKEQELDMHTDAFKKHAVDGKLLLTLDEQDMYKVLNILSPLHRKKLMMAIAELRSSFLNP